MTVVKIEDLLPKNVEVEVSPGKFLSIRPLELQELMTLFASAQDVFMGLYAAVRSPGSNYQKLAPLLMAAPAFVANVLALATDSVGQEKAIRRIPFGVQLIAVHECWRLSVPDPKKLGELLSGVMDDLRALKKEVPVSPDQQPNNSLTEFQNSSKASSPTAIENPTSGATH